MIRNRASAAKVVGLHSAVTPVISNVTAWSQHDTTDQQTYTKSYQSATGHIGLIWTSTNNGAFQTHTDTFNGNNLTQIGIAATNANPNMQIYAGFISYQDIAAAHNMVITLATTKNRNLSAFIFDLSRPPLIGASAVQQGATSLGLLATPITASIVVQNANSRLVGFCAQGVGGAGASFTAPAGFTEALEAFSGGGATNNDTRAQLSHKVAGATGSTTLNSDAVANDGHWSVALIEFLPS